MAETDDFEVAVIDQNDELLEPMRDFQSAQFQRDKAIETLFTFFYAKEIKNRIAFINQKPYIYGLFENFLLL